MDFMPSPDLRDAIDDWRRKHRVFLSRAEAVRQLVKIGLHYGDGYTTAMFEGGTRGMGTNERNP
jgi:hypothetical protein